MASVSPPDDVQRPARLLVVEHDADAMQALCEQLDAMGYQVCGRVDTGRAAVAAAQELAPDLVLINALLPGPLNGIEAAEIICGERATPLLFLSDDGAPETLGRALAARPYGFLHTPCDSRELHAQIEVSLARGRADNQVRDALQWYAATLAGVADSVIVIDADANVRYLNPAAEQLLGWRLADVRGRDIDAVLRLQDEAGNPGASPLRRLLAGDASVMRAGLYVAPRQGGPVLVEDSAAPIHSERGTLLGAVLVLRDIRERAAAEQRLRQSEQRFRNAFDLAPGGMALTGADGRFTEVNAALCRLLGTSAARLAGRRLADFTVGDPGGRAPPAPQRTQPARAVQFEQRLRAQDGGEVWALVSVSQLGPDDSGGQLLQLHDITERKQAERKLARLAHFDALTGLPNRAAISEEIARQIALARRHGQRLAVVFLDLDYFKHVNDTLGHEAGDRLLRVIGRRLRRAVRSSDIVGRLGGDEFVVLLPAITHLTDILKIAAKMQAACLTPVHMLGHELRVGISLGASLYPDDADDARTLLRHADSAMYQAKTEGRSNLQFYRHDMTRGVEQRLRLGASLRRAIDRDEFELYFQPIVRLDTLRPHAVEALLRWHHPQLGLLTPDQFLPLAEDLGLTATLGAWVVQTACRAAAAWQHARPGADVGAAVGTDLGADLGTQPGAAPGAGHGGKRPSVPLQLAVNISPSQFRDRGLVATIAEALRAAGLAPELLCVEITEHLMLGDTERNREILRELRARGIKVAIDDFGTGYSSLSYLGRFSADELKIDRSLTEGMSGGADHAAIVRAAIAMAHSLQLDVISEGIETAQQHALLQAMGCDYGQGYWYLAPCTADQFGQWLAMH
ncbi:MAG: EAL domain-containing protein [Duganella sp.]